jgi:hypothetical protein
LTGCKNDEKKTKQEEDLAQSGFFSDKRDDLLVANPWVVHNLQQSGGFGQQSSKHQ